MADQNQELRGGGERKKSGDSGRGALEPGLRMTAIGEEETSKLIPTPPPVQTNAPEGLSLRPLHRSGTLPPLASPRIEAADAPPETRRRGQTISARPQNLESRILSPRSQMLRRGGSVNRVGNNVGQDMLGSISEKGTHKESGGALPKRPRGSTSSTEAPKFTPGMLPRTSTWTSSSFHPARGGTIRRRPTENLGQIGEANAGRDFDNQSAHFTLAGGPQDTIATNQPYVDPGYSDLNPAYDQPLNTRPVWGLAKPLPRVIRPGMVPTMSELRVSIPAAEEQIQEAENVDLEQGRMEPTLHLGRISSQLDATRQQRENRLLGTMQRANTFSPTSPVGTEHSNFTSSQRERRPSKVIAEEEEEDGSAQPSSLPPVEEHPQGSFDNRIPDDAASIATEKEQDDGALDGDWIGDSNDEIPLKAYEPETDEIHNLHTHWSVIRLRFREPLAELLAVIVQLTLGFCSDLAVTASNLKAGNEATTDWAWGLSTMVGIYIAGGISGAHLNPAISIMLYIYRGFPLRKVPIYIAAQLLGAFLAGLITFALYRKDIIDYGGTDLGNGGTMVAFITYPRYDFVDGVTAFFNEFTATAFLAVAVLALGDDTNAPPGAGMNAFVLGLIITVLSMAFGYNTGAAMNPARDLGPRLALLVFGYGGKALFGNAYWVYGPWLATILGAIFGAFLYDAAIFVGGESPVNYPRKRIRRAGSKWKKRWGRRLRRIGGRRGVSGEMIGGPEDLRKL